MANSFDSTHPHPEWNQMGSQLAPLLGDAYHPCDDFKHGYYVEVARLPKVSEDGQDVILYEGRCPAQFFALTAEATPERTFPHLGTVPGKARIQYFTGSGRDMAQIIVTMATAIRQGMLSARASDADINA